MILALGAIGWVMYNASGGKDATSAIPTGYQESMDKARGVEQTVKEASQVQIEVEERKID
jgi:hypothetical protein